MQTDTHPYPLKATLDHPMSRVREPLLNAPSRKERRNGYSQLRFPAIVAVSSAILVGQLLIGVEPIFSIYISLAYLMGLCAVVAGGGITHFVGFLNLMVFAKFIGIAIPLKLVMLTRTDETLQDPQTTGAAICLGFCGIMLATMQLQIVYKRGHSLFSAPRGSHDYLSLSIAFAAIGYSSFAVGAIADIAGRGEETGGILGIARSLSFLKGFSIIPLAFYVWTSGARRFLSHPLLLGMLTFAVSVGIFSTSKLHTMEPLLGYLLVGIARNGFRDKRIWAIGLSGVVVYTTIVYPYSQFVRYNGGRDGTFEERVAVIWDVLVDVGIGASTKERLAQETRQREVGYFREESLETVNRMSLIGEADRLISSTRTLNDFTGWETLLWGFELAVPKALHPDKPSTNASNYLGRLAGDIQSNDTVTHVSYGVIGNMYNAFGLTGVFLGTYAFFFCFYCMLRLYFGRASWSRAAYGTTIWFLLVVMTYQHSIAEESIAGLVASMILFPPMALFSVGVSRVLRTGLFVSRQ